MLNSRKPDQIQKTEWIIREVGYPKKKHPEDGFRITTKNLRKWVKLVRNGRILYEKHIDLFCPHIF